MGIGEALDWSLRLYRRAFLPIVGIAALFVAPYTAATLYLSSASAGELLLTPLRRATGPQMPGLTPEDLLGHTYLLVLAGLLLGPLIYAALIRVADQAWRGENPTIGGALVWSLRRLFALLVTGLITLAVGLIFTLITVMIVSMTIGLGATLFAAGLMEESELFQIFVGFGLILTFVALVQFAWVGFLFVPQAVVIDSKGYFRAVGRSLALAYTYLFRSVGICWAVVLFTLSLSMIYLLPVVIWELAVGETGLWLVQALSAGLIGLLTFPLLPLATTVVYYDFRLRSEAHDLSAELARLEKGGVPHA